MKKTLAFIGFFLIVFGAYCQKQVIKIGIADTYPKQRLVNEFTTKNAPLFDFTYNSTNLLTFDIDVSKILKIEGISTKFAGKGKIKLQIENPTLALDTTFVFNNNVSVANKYEIEEKLIEAFLNSPEGIKFFGKNINDYLLKVTSKNCADVIKSASKELTNKNWKDAYQKANAILNSDCRNDAQSIIGKIEEAYAEEFCNEKMTRIKILANSGIDYKMEIAVDELYQIPTKAKCKEEAINISKQIGEYFLKKNNGSTKVLNLNQIVSKGNGLDVIFKD
jgi:uncharacterized protein YqgV (UPF0045/DUF77 family)